MKIMDARFFASPHLHFSDIVTLYLEDQMFVYCTNSFEQERPNMMLVIVSINAPNQFDERG